MNKNILIHPEVLQPCDFYPRFCCSACTHFKKCAPGAVRAPGRGPAGGRSKRHNTNRYRLKEESPNLCIITPMPKRRGGTATRNRS